MDMEGQLWLLITLLSFGFWGTLLHISEIREAVIEINEQIRTANGEKKDS